MDLTLAQVVAGFEYAQAMTLPAESSRASDPESWRENLAGSWGMGRI